MKKKRWWIAITAITAFAAVWVLTNSSLMPANADREPTCDELASRLDATIEDTNNPPGRFIISGWEGTVGGVLINAKDQGFDSSAGFYGYDLTFRGINSDGELYLLTLSNETLPYQAGHFYKFDLANRNKYSAELSGSFIDKNLDKLTLVNC